MTDAQVFQRARDSRLSPTEAWRYLKEHVPVMIANIRQFHALGMTPDTITQEIMRHLPAGTPAADATIYQRIIFLAVQHFIAQQELVAAKQRKGRFVW